VENAAAAENAAAGQAEAAGVAEADAEARQAAYVAIDDALRGVDYGQRAAMEPELRQLSDAIESARGARLSGKHHPPRFRQNCGEQASPAPEDVPGAAPKDDQPRQAGLVGRGWTRPQARALFFS
jgi:hypothetical protein